MRATLHPPIPRQPSGDWSGAKGERSQFYFELLYYLVYYPIFWVARLRGRHLMHAGAFRWGSRAVVLVGAQGMGKSTLVANLLPRDDFSFVSDNILLFGNESVRGCEEPLRVDPSLLGGVVGLSELLSRQNVRVPHGRAAFSVPVEKRLDELVPDIFLVPKISSDPTALHRITSEEMSRRIASFNALAEEVRNFGTFAAVMEEGLGSDETSDPSSTLVTLLRNKPCYELNVRYREPTSLTIEALDRELTSVLTTEAGNGAR